MNDRSDDEFTAQERALLATWDRHNAPVAANDECDAAFEHRLIAAYHAAREASLRVAESNDEAICRQIAADARADAGGAVPSGAARLEAPAAAVTVSPARLAGVAFAGAALGGVMTVLGIGVCGRRLTVEPSHRSPAPLVARQVAPAPLHDAADRDRGPHGLLDREFELQHASCIRPPPPPEPRAAPCNPRSLSAAPAKTAPARARPPAPREDAATGPDIAALDCVYRRALAALEARSRPAAHTWAFIADGTALISRSYARTGPTCDRSLAAVLVEKKIVQRSGIGLR